MQLQRGRWGGLNGNGFSESNRFVSISTASVSSPSPASNVNYIEHRISKFDTLAGVAIKYGVEVADIKRMNGLVTDLQMFAHKSLQIPLPGKHPPSPMLANGSACNGEQTPSHQPQSDVLGSFHSLKLKPPPQQKVSAAMSSLQGYYGLTPSRKELSTKDTEMAIYGTGRAIFLEDESLSKNYPLSYPLGNHHRKTKSLIGFLLENGGKFMEDTAVIKVSESSESDISNSEQSVRRRPKADADPSMQMPEILLDDSRSGLSTKMSKGATHRPKAGSRTDNDICLPISITNGDPSIASRFLSVRKSSSTSNLQESESSSVWPPWNLKPDVISRPIFDGLPKPMTLRRTKAAMD